MQKDISNSDDLLNQAKRAVTRSSCDLICAVFELRRQLATKRAASEGAQITASALVETTLESFAVSTMYSSVITIELKDEHAFAQAFLRRLAVEIRRQSRRGRRSLYRAALREEVFRLPLYILLWLASFGIWSAGPLYIVGAASGYLACSAQEPCPECPECPECPGCDVCEVCPEQKICVCDPCSECKACMPCRECPDNQDCTKCAIRKSCPKDPSEDESGPSISGEDDDSSSPDVASTSSSDTDQPKHDIPIEAQDSEDLPEVPNPVDLIDNLGVLGEATSVRADVEVLNERGFNPPGEVLVLDDSDNERMTDIEALEIQPRLICVSPTYFRVNCEPGH